MTTKGIYTYAPTKVTAGSQPSYQIWNNTVRASYGIVFKKLSGTSYRVDHAVRNNYLEDCTRHIYGAEETIDEGNAKMAWGVSAVSSWYKTNGGRVAQNWPYSLLEYWDQTREIDPDDYEVLT